ncbi:hypothetical protein CEXT_138381 [Caerostris extrusa]|uniref:Uncharacterized protein n=1 Tax=Caerostris extrusa TaxID=172846 RepID=A0AAV4VNX5_CAEEX|nr:hypothetical protein CEXT_138381 [Caerostris extrusa]
MRIVVDGKWPDSGDPDSKPPRTVRPPFRSARQRHSEPASSQIAERGHAKSQSLSTRLDTHTDQIQSHLTLSGLPPPLCR